MPQGVYTRTSEHRKKISEAVKGKIGYYVRTPETRKKMSLAMIGRKHSQETK